MAARQPQYSFPKKLVRCASMVVGCPLSVIRHFPPGQHSRRAAREPRTGGQPTTDNGQPSKRGGHSLAKSCTNPPVDRRRGFSLAEVLIAASLLGVILLALFGLVSAGSRRAYGGKKMTQGSFIAQTVMERANTYAPQDLLGAASSASTATKTWTRSGASTTPAAESGTSTPVIERNAWRALLANADLPSSASDPATLTVTTTAVPSGRTFANATMVRIVVDVTWSEFGTRRRQIRLQSMNLRVAP